MLRSRDPPAAPDRLREPLDNVPAAQHPSVAAGAVPAAQGQGHRHVRPPPTGHDATDPPPATAPQRRIAAEGDVYLCLGSVESADGATPLPLNPD